ncbi:FAD-linked sulfhydryl oxidase ERV1 isoform X2 [Aristolochia californica]|uniref:FAD-linked sulfhydryl oxidase ERV1 isoform X2 n=1 Tax=Aristolochia californica TaxID=171875 RepID=UPI0035E26381
MVTETTPSMSQNPWQIVLKPCESFFHCVQTHLSNFIGDHFPSEKQKQTRSPLLSAIPKHRIGSSSNEHVDEHHPLDPVLCHGKGQKAKPLSKEELGRATWTLLHTLAAQYPDHPTKQQKRDMAILSRLYPCRECADHFKEVLKANPVQAGSQPEFSQWMCHVHNVVNRSLGKLVFPCQRVDARWGKLECQDRACDLEGTDADFSNHIR